jgi:hypothetical protein
VKLRLLPIVLTVVVSSGLLFGGWFLYQSLAVDNPIKDIAQGIPGIIRSDIQIDRDSIHLTLQLSADADLRSVYDEVREKTQSVAGDRSLTIDIDGESSELLESWWSVALFDIAQAMENRQYGDIPVRLNELASGSNGLKVWTEMDDENVYVHLNEGSHHKYIILPRTPMKLGVWSNEPV